MARDKYGIYRGAITDVRDPRKQGRVRVRVPQVLGQATSSWADFATAPQRAPKVGDRVFIQFVGGDTRYPLWRQILATKDVGVFTDLLVTGTATINDLTVTGDTELEALDVGGASDFHGVADFRDTTVFHDETYFDEPAVFNETTRYEGAATFNDPATFTAQVNINGGITFSGGITTPGITVNGATDLNGGLDVSGGATIGGLINANGGINLPGGNWIKRGSMTGIPWQSGWGNYGGGYQNPAYIEYPDRTAGLTGMASVGTVSTTATEVVVANIPVAVRPAGDHVYLCAAEAGNHTQIVMQANGNILQRRASSGTIGWVSFSGIRWPMNGF